MEDFLVFRKPVFYQTAGKESAVGRRRRWEVYPAQRIYGYIGYTLGYMERQPGYLFFSSSIIVRINSET